MITSRKVEDLLPMVQVKFKEFAAKMAEAGIPFMITSTFRDQESQNVLFNQGRTSPGKIVTWTHHSRHTERDAFDVAILRSGKPVWDAKVDVDGDNIPDYQEAGQIGQACGLEWGGVWKKPDYPHFQNKKEV